MKKFIKTIIAMMIAITITIPLVESQVHAGADYRSDLNNPGRATIDGGPTSSRTGWLFYLVSAEGGQVSGTRGCTNGHQFNINGVRVPYSSIRLFTRFGGRMNSNDMEYTCEWGFDPWVNAVGTADKLKEWMLTKEGGVPRAMGFVAQQFGPDFAKQWKDKEVYLAFEPFYWTYSYSFWEKDRYPFCSTAVGWGNEMYTRWESYYAGSKIYYRDLLNSVTASAGAGMTDEIREEIKEEQAKYTAQYDSLQYGPGEIKRYTNGVFNTCAISGVEDEIRAIGIYEPGFSGTFGGNRMMTYKAMRSTSWGHGLGFVWNDDLLGIKTYDKAKGSPAGAEDPVGDKAGTATIIKGYYEEDTVTGAKINKGVFVTSNASENIKILNEPNYKIVKWSVSTSTATNLNPTNWNPTGVTSSGTSPKSVKLKTPEKTVYVLLKKSKGTPVGPPPPPVYPFNYDLKEYEISKRISLNRPQYPSSVGLTKDNMILNHDFQWSIGGHQTSCSGHHYTCTDWQSGGCGVAHDYCGGKCWAKSGPEYVDDLSKPIVDALGNTIGYEQKFNEAVRCDGHIRYYCHGHTDYCDRRGNPKFDWKSRLVNVSVINTLQNNYPTAITTKDAFRQEVADGSFTKRVERGLERPEHLRGAGWNINANYPNIGKNWDYVNVIHRGKDNLTVAQWKNDAVGNSANRELKEFGGNH